MISAKGSDKSGDLARVQGLPGLELLSTAFGNMAPGPQGRLCFSKSMRRRKKGREAWINSNSHSNNSNNNDSNSNINSNNNSNSNNNNDSNSNAVYLDCWGLGSL